MSEIVEGRVQRPLPAVVIEGSSSNVVNVVEAGRLVAACAAASDAYDAAKAKFEAAGQEHARAREACRRVPQGTYVIEGDPWMVEPSAFAGGVTVNRIKVVYNTQLGSL